MLLYVVCAKQTNKQHVPLVKLLQCQVEQIDGDRLELIDL